MTLFPVSEYHPEANGVAESKVIKDLLRMIAANFVHRCEICQQMKTPHTRNLSVSYLQCPQPDYPRQMISMDVMHLPSAANCKYIFILVDLFSRWPEAFALPSVNFNGCHALTICFKLPIYPHHCGFVLWMA